MLPQNQTPDLVARVQKPWPAGTLAEPKKIGIWAYFGAGSMMVGIAGVFFSVGQPPETYVAPLFVVLATVMYIRAAQFYNYFYGR